MWRYYYISGNISGVKLHMSIQLGSVRPMCCNSIKIKLFNLFFEKANRSPGYALAAHSTHLNIETSERCN